jgi:hypothetical protein
MKYIPSTRYRRNRAARAVLAPLSSDSRLMRLRFSHRKAAEHRDHFFI